MKKLIIVVAQINPLVGDIKGNALRIIQESQIIVEKYQADLILFPELALCGYPPEDLLFRPGFYSRCRNALQTILDAQIATTIVCGYPEKIEDKSYNEAVVIQHGKLIATYAKQDLPNYTVFDEKRYFTPGTSPCVIKIKGIKIGITICEDLWHVGPGKQAVKAGAQILLSLNASPFDRNKVKDREHILSERASKLQVPIIYANLVGGQDELVFDGGSMVINENGQRCQQAAYFKEDRMVVEVEYNKTVKVHPQKLPVRLSAEENLYEALVLGVKDYIDKNHFPGAIIGLSGGIDSAMTLAIAVDAIGAERVIGVLMPSRYTAAMSLEDAKKQAETHGVKYHIISIEAIFEAFLKNLAPIFANHKPDTTEENLQARIRGTLLMSLSNKFGHIVLTTGNKSELSVGYATLYGDMAGGFAVLKDIFKTMVYRLARYRNNISEVIPDRVIARPPSAELAPNQKDQDSLPPYSVLDEILERYIEFDQDPQQIYAAGLDKETVNKVIRMVNRNEYKRRQAPVGIRTTERAFGKDRRYPITSGFSLNI